MPDNDLPPIGRFALLAAYVTAAVRPAREPRPARPARGRHRPGTGRTLYDRTITLRPVATEAPDTNRKD